MMRSLAACLLFAGLAMAAAETPYVPGQPDIVLEQVPAADDPQEQALQRMRQRLRQSPRDLGLASDFARAAIERARATADPRYTGYAQAALAPWWDQSEPPLPVRILRATIAQRRHRFGPALAELDAVLAGEPDHAQARLTRAAILTVQAHYARALSDCAALTGRVDALVVAACAAAPASLSGRAEPSLSGLIKTLRRAPKAASGVRVWAQTTAAEIAVRLGRSQSAERYFEAALAMAETPDPYLRLAYADFLLDQGRPQKVVALLQDFTAIDAALLRLALAEQQLAAASVAGMPARLEQHRAALAARFAAAQRRSDTRHRREQAIFELHLRSDPATALRLARANWADQKEPVDARILLEAALAAGESEAAQPVQRWLAEHGVQAERLQALSARLAKQAGR